MIEMLIFFNKQLKKNSRSLQRSDGILREARKFRCAGQRKLLLVAKPVPGKEKL